MVGARSLASRRRSSRRSTVRLPTVSSIQNADGLHKVPDIVAGSQKPIVAAIHSDSGRATSEIALELAAVARHVRNLCQQSQFSRLVKYETDAKTRGDCIKPVGVVLVISADFGAGSCFWWVNQV